MPAEIISHPLPYDHGWGRAALHLGAPDIPGPTDRRSHLCGRLHPPIGVEDQQEGAT